MAENSSQLIIVRHGQSAWNLENRFTGWVDVDLSEKGKAEAKAAGDKLIGYHFQAAFTSVLIRAQHTLDIILEDIGQQGIPVFKDKALNERMYGDLQGLNKLEIKEKYGEQQFNTWRRSYAVAPPNGESLKQTAERVIPYYISTIEPHLLNGETILIAAHGNSLRALMMHLEKISETDIEHTEIATGIPRIYEFLIQEPFASTTASNDSTIAANVSAATTSAINTSATTTSAISKTKSSLQLLSVSNL